MKDVSKVHFQTGKARPDPVCNLDVNYQNTILTTVVQQRSGLEFRWLQPVDNGDPILYYEVTITSVDKVFGYKSDKVLGSNNQDFAIVASDEVNIVAGSAYFVGVTATNALGTSRCCKIQRCQIPTMLAASIHFTNRHAWRP